MSPNQCFGRRLKLPHRGTSEKNVVHMYRSTRPRIPTMPGRITSRSHQPGRHCLHQARSTVRCSASRMKGELHISFPRTARKTDFGALCLLSCLLMTAPMSYTLFSGVITPFFVLGTWYGKKKRCISFLMILSVQEVCSELFYGTPPSPTFLHRGGRF